MQRFWGKQTNKQRKDASGCVTIMGATKIVLLSTLVAVLGFLAFMELQIVTVSFSFESLYIPAKRSDVFRTLMDDPELWVKAHPLW